jgi:hypothetical protein
MIKHKWDTVDGESWWITVGNMQGRVWIYSGFYTGCVCSLQRVNYEERIGCFEKLEEAKEVCEERIAMLLPTEDPDNDTD